MYHIINGSTMNHALASWHCIEEYKNNIQEKTISCIVLNFANSADLEGRILDFFPFSTYVHSNIVY